MKHRIYSHPRYINQPHLSKGLQYDDADGALYISSVDEIDTMFVELLANCGLVSIKSDDGTFLPITYDMIKSVRIVGSPEVKCKTLLSEYDKPVILRFWGEGSKQMRLPIIIVSSALNNIKNIVYDRNCRYRVSGDTLYINDYTVFADTLDCYRNFISKKNIIIHFDYFLDDAEFDIHDCNIFVLYANEDDDEKYAISTISAYRPINCNIYTYGHSYKTNDKGELLENEPMQKIKLMYVDINGKIMKSEDGGVIDGDFVSSPRLFTKLKKEQSYIDYWYNKR